MKIRLLHIGYKIIIKCIKKLVQLFKIHFYLIKIEIT
jgi:hypothetical protein